jgi:hypothetical protein
VVAIYGAVTATAGLTWQVAWQVHLRRTSRRVRIIVELVRFDLGEGLMPLAVTIYNRSERDLELTSIVLAWGTGDSQRAPWSWGAMTRFETSFLSLRGCFLPATPFPT